MKIKSFISNIVAALTLVALVSGFQVQSTEAGVLSLEKAVGIEEAYAGPCGSAGCDGLDMYCTSVTVFHIGDIQILKDCDGTPLDDDKLPQQQ